MNRLIIIGAGAFGRETLDWLLELPPVARDWDCIAGFLDSNPQALDGIECSHPLLARLEDYQPQSGDRFLCTVGAPRTRLHLCESLQQRGAIFTSVIHRQALISARATLGTGCLIGPFTSVSNNTMVGDHSFVLANAVLAHDCRVGKACNLSPGVAVSGHCTIGDAVMLGANATLLPGAHVGDHATIGAGSVVLRSVKAGSTVLGVPAKQIGGFEP